MSSGLGLSAATEVGIKQTPNSASLDASVGAGGLSARLEINVGTGEPGTNCGDALADDPETSSPESLLKNDGTDRTETEEKPEAQSPDATDKAEQDEKPEAQSPDATDKTEQDQKPETQTPDVTEKPEAQTSDAPEKTELEDKQNVQTPEATVKTQKKPEASVTKNSEKGKGKSDSAPADGSDEAKPERSRSCAAHEDNAPTESQRGFRIFGVEFAPLNTPMRRRLQTLAVLQWLLSITVMPVICVIFIGLTLFTPLAPLSLAYIGWVLFFDRNTSQRGGRRWERIRRWSLWRHYRDYFPIRLVKSADLDPAHNYLIGYHPHGIISCGAFCNFGTEATGFSAKFPGIKPYLLTLRLNFYWPLLRGYYLATGVCDVSRSSLQWILNREEGGNAAIIVVGGAQEALDARPGNYKLTLLKRKGFARMALQTGAHLVPCFSFGENDLFRQADNPPGSWVRAFQQIFKGAMGSSPPFFYGRGVFNYTFGLLPFRRAVTTVIGAPIPVEKCAEPTAEQVDRLHHLYMDRLADLFDEHKVENGVEEKVRLEFV